jgi:hypothetical protein
MRSPLSGCLSHEYLLVFDFKLDLAVWQQYRRLSDRQRDCYLAFTRDSHANLHESYYYQWDSNLPLCFPQGRAVGDEKKRLWGRDTKRLSWEVKTSKTMLS